MAPIEFTIYNAFSSGSLEGNPAAVIVLPKTDSLPAAAAESHGEIDSFPYALFPPTSTLQDIAKEVNLPMTAFLVPLQGSDGDVGSAHYAVRWFNIHHEAPLCGHATLALSYHLFETLPNCPQTLRYLTRLHGIVSASQYQNAFGEGKLVGIVFPELTNLPSISKASPQWNRLKDIFEDATSSTWQDTEEPVGVYEDDQYVLIEFNPEMDLKALQIDPKKLGKIAKFVYVFQISAQTSEHIHTRVINTALGNQHEDIATGSAHRAIVPHALTNPETQARLHKYHPDFKGKILRCVQQSPEGGELTVEWLQERKEVLIMGKVSIIGKRTLKSSLGN